MPSLETLFNYGEFPDMSLASTFKSSSSFCASFISYLPAQFSYPLPEEFSQVQLIPMCYYLREPSCMYFM